MGMFDSIYISGTCQGCKTPWEDWEFQTKAGDRTLEAWTLGSKTTLPGDWLEMIEDAWCTTCAYTPLTESERIQNALQGYPISEHHIDNTVCRRNADAPETYVRFRLKDSILLEAEFLEMCQTCRGRRSYPPVTRQVCQACEGRGYVDKIMEMGRACPDKVRKSMFADITPESFQAGLDFLKNLGHQKP